MTNIEYFEKLYETVKDCDACVILTEWPEVVAVDLERLRAALKQPIIVDGRNVFDLRDMKEHGFVYCSMGRPHVNRERVTNP